MQLAPHTHLVLDETCLQQGKLQNKGVEAVVQLSNLIRNQKLNVDFKFYTIDYNANVPVLILSEGKSMFPVSKIIKVLFVNANFSSYFLYIFFRAIAMFH